MKKKNNKHSQPGHRFYKLFISKTVSKLIILTFFSLIAPYFLTHEVNEIHVKFNTNPLFNEVLILFLTILFLTITFQHIGKIPGGRSVSFILPECASWYAITLLLFLVFKVDFSLKFFFSSFIMTNGLYFVFYFLEIRYGRLAVGYVPLGKIEELQPVSRIRYVKITEPFLSEEIKIDALVVDLACPQLKDRWQTFLSKITLAKIPVYNFKQYNESITGRTKITHLYENDLGSLLPSQHYSLFKSGFDLLTAIIMLPLILPLMLIISLIIRIESPGKSIFKQQRVGQGGRLFTIYKFRSMRIEKQLNHFQFTEQDDPRVTKFGRFLRQSRLDEIPQFFNILKGEMSLIGPRPEYIEYAKELEKDLAFYQYRSIVKPGISGWAQVMQGHVTGAYHSRIKLEYDFYYIKNFSLWLDLLIILKTLKTLVTGFGAK